MRLLILSCSQRKRPDAGLLPAIERYDGPKFRILRSWQRRDPQLAEQLLVRIVSAKYGVITPRALIADYDQKLTEEQSASEWFYRAVDAPIKAFLHNEWQELYGAERLSSVLIVAGRLYRAMLDGYVWPTDHVIAASGGIGKQNGQLKTWLEQGQ